ncbi:MAG TPA: phospholipid carrier-dependent glycosyltransferase [Nitriliruptorales bacterium]
MGDAGARLTAGAVVIAAIIAATAILAGTATYGPGTYFDSAVYLSMADGIRDGSGLVMHDGAPAVIWPPGYSTVIAAVGWTLGLATETAARVTNALAVGLTVVGVGALTYRFTASRVAAVLAAWFVALSASSLQASMFVMSEPVFAVWYVAAGACLAGFAHRGRRWWLVAAGLSTAGAVITRYVGVVFVPVGLLVAVVAAAGGLRRRLGAACVYSAAALGPTVPLLARNLAVSGTLTGPRDPAQFGIVESVEFFAQGLATWLHPGSALRIFELSWAVPATLAVLITCVVAVTLAWRRRQRPWEGQTVLVVALTGMAAALASFVVVSAVTTKIDPFYQRQLAPLVPGMTIVVAIGACHLRSVAFSERGRRWLTASMVASAVLLIGLNGTFGLEAVRADRARGVGGLTLARELAVPFRAEVAERLPAGTVYSNGSELIYLDTGRRVPYSPSVDVLRRRTAEGPVFIIYYDYGRYPRRPPDLMALTEAFEVDVVAEAVGGRILRVTER